MGVVSECLQYGWRERRRTTRALRQGRPLSPDERPVADAIVRAMRKQRWVPYLFGIVLPATSMADLIEDVARI